MERIGQPFFVCRYPHAPTHYPCGAYQPISAIADSDLLWVHSGAPDSSFMGGGSVPHTHNTFPCLFVLAEEEDWDVTVPVPACHQL